jgi:hypothetical protein
LKYRFIAVIHFLKLDKPECRIPLKVGMITNKASLIKDVLSYKSILALHTIGVHSIDEFQGKSYYLADGDFDPTWSKDDINNLGTQVTFAFLRQIQQVTDALWTIRDNSVYIRDGFLFVYDRILEDGMSFKASLGTIYTQASTDIGDVVFTKEEILKAASEIEELSLPEVKDGKKDYSLPDQFQYFKGAKIGRKFYAWIYIHFARSNSAIPVKILMYVTAMEALVSTTTIELSHQVSERIALLLGTDKASRLLIYSEIKKAYGYRSKAAHGESLKGTEQEMMAFLTEIDEYLRQLMKFVEPYCFDDKKINDFFLDKLMS